ncbi:IS110 family transposase [Ornithinimicrobium sufpigmenti]|uniref:IS110 family transposase n=1 Tax=Ornithinimicrobium sufpigmenti TaxID=2508882 RepID=UPI0010360199|nr:IS110 family transposase [Ornithinimicrobium sp. HY006]
MNEQEPLRVVIGMDPHKRSVTIEVMTADESILGGGRFSTDADGYARLLAYARAWPHRVWAVEGCAGIGKHVADRLVADGEDVVDVPAKMSARVRIFTTGQGRKTDATDAHSIALVGVRMSGLRPVINDDQLEVLRMCVDRRRSLGEEHTRKVCQLHKLLLELIPGGAKTSLSAAQAKELLKKVRPTTAAGKVRKAHAVELAEDLAKIYARTKAADKELKALVEATGTTLMSLHGIGPSGAARLLVEVGDVTRFPDRNHFASWTGTAPIDASSGEHTRHRLSRGGNRQINRVLHIMAVVQLRTRTTEGRAYYDRKKAGGKTSMEALRCLKRRLSDLVYKAMLDDLAGHTKTGPGGHKGDDSDSSATGSQPAAGSSDKPLPGPATTKPTTTLPAAS